MLLTHVLQLHVMAVVVQAHSMGYVSVWFSAHLVEATSAGRACRDLQWHCEWSPLCQGLWVFFIRASPAWPV